MVSHAEVMMMNAHIENLKSHNNIKQGLEQPGKDMQTGAQHWLT